MEGLQTAARDQLTKRGINMKIAAVGEAQDNLSESQKWNGGKLTTNGSAHIPLKNRQKA